MLEFVLTQVWLQQPNEFERIQIARTLLFQRYGGQIALQIEIQNMIIVVGIVSQQHAVAHIIHEHLQSFSMTMQHMSLHFSNQWIFNLSQLLRNVTVGFHKNYKRRAGNHFPLPHPDSCNLHDVVLKNIQSGGLCVEHYNILLLVTLYKFLHITALWIYQKVGWQHRPVQQSPHKATRCRIALKDMQPHEQA